MLPHGASQAAEGQFGGGAVQSPPVANLEDLIFIAAVQQKRQSVIPNHLHNPGGSHHALPHSLAPQGTLIFTAFHHVLQILCEKFTVCLVVQCSQLPLACR